jgi:hypothetical protein
MVTVTAAVSPQNQTLPVAYAAQTLAVGTTVEWQFNFAALKWFRVR